MNVCHVSYLVPSVLCAVGEAGGVDVSIGGSGVVDGTSLFLTNLTALRNTAGGLELDVSGTLGCRTQGHAVCVHGMCTFAAGSGGGGGVLLYVNGNRDVSSTFLELNGVVCVLNTAGG
jgi:hypothetical protein